MALPQETAAAGGTLLEVLKELRKYGGLRHHIPDPVAWQREIREDVTLPGRD